MSGKEGALGKLRKALHEHKLRKFTTDANFERDLGKAGAI
jgi:hypothetical protein